MEGRWPDTQVLGLAPDAASAAAGRKLSSPVNWSGTGCTDIAVWGACKGSGKNPYQTIVALDGPAFRCSCPSRKFPCKHTLGLLLLWSTGQVADAPDLPEHVTTWLGSRTERAEKAAQRAAEPSPRNAERAEATAARRAERVVDGLADFDRWLRDQISGGLAGSDADAYRRFDPVGARLVDAQAPAMASAVRRLPAAVAGSGWPDRLLHELSLLRLLVVAYGRIDQCDDDTAATIREHVGFPVASEQVLSRPPVRDLWVVLGWRDSDDEATIRSRRIWLRGNRSGQIALVLSFAAGQASLDSSLPPGTAIDADLHFYPGRAGWRALVGTRHSEPAPAGPLASGDCVSDLADQQAAALARDPWLIVHPAVLAGRFGQHGEQKVLIDDEDRWIPLSVDDNAWAQLLAETGGTRVVLAGELKDGLVTPIGWFPTATPTATPTASAPGTAEAPAPHSALEPEPAR